MYIRVSRVVERANLGPKVTRIKELAGIKRLLKRHMVWIVLVAVAAPLLLTLYLQYESLTELRRTTPVANKAMMRKYLATLAEQIEGAYRAGAEQTLSIPPGIFDRMRIQTKYSDAASYFESSCSNLAKRVFVGYTGHFEMGKDYSIVLFYDPEAMRFTREPGSAQWRAAHEASSQWLYYASLDVDMLNLPPGSPIPMTVSEADPENRIITRPILDGQYRVIGVSGMIVDPSPLKGQLLPQIVGESLPKFFPDDSREVVITLKDGQGNLLYANRESSAQGYELYEPLQFIFKDWRLNILMTYGPEEQRARMGFIKDLSLMIVMALLVIGGIFMALRTASREMKLSQMKADFVSNVSHELRTPLASIRVFGEFLRLDRVKDHQKVREYGQHIEDESRRLTQLINNILDFSRMESGYKTYSFAETDVLEIVRGTIKSQEVRLNETGFKVVFDPPPFALPPANVDPDAIARALGNLLDNAVKYSTSEKEITVRAEKKDEFIAISVTDRGIGIAREEREKIFEKFYRVGTGLVHDVKGSGLGLSLVKHIVEAHGGIVTVSSKPGSGSTFTMYLPVAARARTGTPANGDRPFSGDADAKARETEMKRDGGVDVEVEPTTGMRI
jgi:signal transduction histidine kinase